MILIENGPSEGVSLRIMSDSIRVLIDPKLSDSDFNKNYNISTPKNKKYCEILFVSKYWIWKCVFWHILWYLYMSCGHYWWILPKIQIFKRCHESLYLFRFFQCLIFSKNYIFDTAQMLFWISSLGFILKYCSCDQVFDKRLD